MGSWDRDYYEPTEKFERRITFNAILIGAIIAVFSIQVVWQFLLFRTDSATATAIDRWLGLHSIDVVEKFRVWQLGTHLFLHHDIFAVFFDALALYFFGSMIEEMVGRKKYAILFFGGGLISAVVFTAIGYLWLRGAQYAGPMGAIMAVLVMAACSRPNDTVIFFIFPMRLKYVVLLYVVADIYYTLTTLGPGSLAHLAGAGWGLAFWKYQGRVGQALERLDEAFESRAREKKEATEREFEEDVDRVLDKIAREGMGSLSPRERKLLDEASRRKRVR